MIYIGLLELINSNTRNWCKHGTY